MIALLFVVTTLAAPAQRVSMDCHLWEQEVGKSPVRPNYELKKLWQEGFVRIGFRIAGKELRDVHVINFADPLDLSNHKKISWRGGVFGPSHFRIWQWPEKGVSRSIELKANSNGQFAAEWHYSANAGSPAIQLVGDGYGQCAPNHVGESE